MSLKWVVKEMSHIRFSYHIPFFKHDNSLLIPSWLSRNTFKRKIRFQIAPPVYYSLSRERRKRKRRKEKQKINIYTNIERNCEKDRTRERIGNEMDDIYRLGRRKYWYIRDKEKIGRKNISDRTKISRRIFFLIKFVISEFVVLKTSFCFSCAQKNEKISMFVWWK